MNNERLGHAILQLGLLPREIVSAAFRRVGPGGDLWIMNQNSRVQQYTGTKFENRPKGTALQAQDMAVGADGSVYVIQNSDSLLKKWNAQRWF